MIGTKQLAAEPKIADKLGQKLGKFLHVRPAEAPALAWSWLYVFALFLAYYVLRPIRDELGLAGGVENLPWLFTGTLVAMLAINPVFAYAVRRWTRERFIAVAYRFFMLNLLGFMLLLTWATPAQQVWVGRAFFIWISVFNLFVVSVFWSFIVDVFDAEQGKRLFGILAAGSTLGGLVGSALSAGFIARLGQNWLLLASFLLLEVAVFAARRLSHVSEAFRQPLPGDDGQQPVGGGIFSGLTHTFRSPYLLGLTFFILFYTVTSTILYFQQATIVEATIVERVARVAFFARIDLWVNSLTLVLQVFLTGRLLTRLGVMAMLCVLPVSSLLGFAALAAYPTIAVFVVVQVVRRVSNYALARPAREVLFTSVAREDRYKAKNFIDTVVYRGGDQFASWAYAGLLGLGLTLSGVAVFAVPLSAAWLGLSIWLGRQQKTASLPSKLPGRRPNRLRRRSAHSVASAARF